jgi:hypothetical protein
MRQKAFFLTLGERAPLDRYRLSYTNGTSVGRCRARSMDFRRSSALALTAFRATGADFSKTPAATTKNQRNARRMNAQSGRLLIDGHRP